MTTPPPFEIRTKSRRSVLEQDDLSDVELHLFQTVAEKSHDNLDYLMAALFDNSYMFTDAGRDFVETLSEFTQVK